MGIRQVKFLKIKGKSQRSRRAVQVSPFRPGPLTDDSLATHRKLVSSSLKLHAETRRMELLHLRDYDMQCNWLSLVDKVIADDLTWQKIIYGYSSRLLKLLIHLRANTSLLLTTFDGGISKDPTIVAYATRRMPLSTIS